MQKDKPHHFKGKSKSKIAKNVKTYKASPFGKEKFDGAIPAIILTLKIKVRISV